MRNKDGGEGGGGLIEKGGLINFPLKRGWRGLNRVFTVQVGSWIRDNRPNILKDKE